MDNTSSAPVKQSTQTELNSQLLTATTYGRAAIVTALLSSAHFNATTLNATDEDGDTALMLVAYSGHTAIVTALLSSAHFNATTLNATGQFGDTALMLAARNGHTAIVRALLSSTHFSATTLNAANQWGETALILATRNGHNEMAFSLLNSMSPQAIFATRPNPSFINRLLRRVPVITPVEASYNQALTQLRQGLRNMLGAFNEEASRSNLGTANALMNIIAGYYAPDWCLNPNREMRLVLREITNPVIFSRTSNLKNCLQFAFNRLTHAAEPPGEQGLNKKPGRK